MKTKGRTYRFEAYHVLPDSPQMQKDFLYVLASLGERSSDPKMKEVLRIARVNNILPVEVQGFQEFENRGLGGLVTMPDEQRLRAVIMGSREFMAESGLQIPDILEVTARQWEKEPDRKVLLAGWDGWVRGVLKFRQN